MARVDCRKRFVSWIQAFLPNRFLRGGGEGSCDLLFFTSPGDAPCPMCIGLYSPGAGRSSKLALELRRLEVGLLALGPLDGHDLLVE